MHDRWAGGTGWSLVSGQGEATAYSLFVRGPGDAFAVVSTTGKWLLLRYDGRSWAPLPGSAPGPGKQLEFYALWGRAGGKELLLAGKAGEVLRHWPER